MKPWTPDHWRQYEPVQMPVYTDTAALKHTTQRLEQSAPLIFAGEADHLRQSLGEVAEGRAFLLQGGDCAESFAHYHPDNIQRMFQVFLQMAMVMTYGAGCPVIKVGRIAGQFAKPRSADYETRGKVSLPSFRGDIINGIEFNQAARTPDPERMLRGYSQSAATLNFLRGLAQGGFADLAQVNHWNADFLADSPLAERYHALNSQIDDALRFLQACQIDLLAQPSLGGVDFYVSHEALLLEYEQALTRFDVRRDQWYDTSAHLLWIGDRTRDPQGAHVNFLRGVANPLGLKAGPGMKTDDLLRLINILNPDNIPGRLTIITRMGADKVAHYLPGLIRAVQAEGASVVWSCDPMHGNTQSTAAGLKTRPFDNIMREVRQFFAVHKAEGSHAGGIHLEMTGRNVTECVGGAEQLSEQALKQQYETQCDPRLNASQSLELAFLMAEMLKERRVVV
jgi:3-deoxy-7-phosphoheptulonate synthase